MSNTTKSWAKSVLDGYNSSLSLLTEKYLASIKSINDEHNFKNREIEKTAGKRKNSADTSSKIALSNVKGSLLQKGLSKSGESVQAELDNNLQKMTAMSQIERDAEDARAQNEQDRSKAKSSALISLIGGIGSLEEAKNDAYIKQLNSDRDYEAEREDEKFDRYVTNRDYEAEREDEKFDRYVTNRDYEAEREDENYDRYMQEKEFKADREDESYDRFSDNREREDRIKSEFRELLNSGEGSTGKKAITPEYSAKVLVDKISSSYRNKYGDNKDGEKAIRNAIAVVISDSRIDYSYRYQVMMYAKSIGVY